MRVCRGNNRLSEYEPTNKKHIIPRLRIDILSARDQQLLYTTLSTFISLRPCVNFLDHFSVLLLKPLNTNTNTNTIFLTPVPICRLAGSIILGMKLQRRVRRYTICFYDTRFCAQKRRAEI